ncbi:hypothetical protein H4L53_004535 [Salmonella enterica]|nr:hypothetical protein [Salmonella enterica subsp. enterica serovar Florida]EFZ9263070.1 hypothetical protein [Salmonella enterica]EII5458640.1 hypothetical protein [Salmonella enterica]
MLPVLIYADRWPLAHALETLCRQQCPGRPVLRCDSLSVLSHMLQSHPQGPLMLGVSAHEQVFLLYAIHPLLRKRKVMVVADDIYYSDRLVLECAGVRGIVRVGSLCSLLSRSPQAGHPLYAFLAGPDIPRVTVTPVTVWGHVDDSEELLLLMNALMTYRLGLSGLKAQEVRVLRGLWSGVPMATLAWQMGITYVTLSGYKVRALHMLGIKNHPGVFMRSGPPRADLQRTPFMTTMDFMGLGREEQLPVRDRKT